MPCLECFRFFHRETYLHKHTSTLSMYNRNRLFSYISDAFYLYIWYSRDQCPYTDTDQRKINNWYSLWVYFFLSSIVFAFVRLKILGFRSKQALQFASTHSSSSSSFLLTYHQANSAILLIKLI
jgi:hypothetical protein